MMGVKENQQPLFAYNINLEERVRKNHPLRKVKELVDFTFVRGCVGHLYGYNGNESVDPVIILKMMFLLFFDDVGSERELMNIISERLDYLWFLDYSLDEAIPNHSVLSKARKKWGKEVFEELFTRIVRQCVEEGLIAGNKIHMDGSLVDANASNDSVIKANAVLIAELKAAYDSTAKKLDEPNDSDEPREKPKYYDKINDTLMSTTDPDAVITRKGFKEARLRYKHHRAVDDKHGVITAVETTAGDVEENRKAFALIEQHERNTSIQVKTVIADAQYGTVKNMVECARKGIECHMSDMSKKQKVNATRSGIYSESDFHYDTATDTYTCPAGKTLIRRKHKAQRRAYEYSASRKECENCACRPQCTRADKSSVRTIKRHYEQELLNIARQQSITSRAYADRARRKWLMEGSFADAANNHGFKRARWRRLYNQEIQNFLIAAIQNVRILMKHAGAPLANALQQSLAAIKQSFSFRISIACQFFAVDLN